MSRDRDANCSDLDRARALTRSLGGDKKGAQPPAESGYIRFDAARFAVPAAKVPAKETPRHAPPEEHSDWGTLLGWVRALAGADAVFVSDAQGLLVGLAGDVTQEQAEAMGARLVLAVEHVDRLADSHTSRFMSVEFGASVVSGMCIDLRDGGRLVLGIASKEPIDPNVRNDVQRALTERAQRA